MSIQKVTYSAILGVVLSNLRKQQSIEQGKMAELMGLSQASYSRLEAGKATFSIDQMYQAAIALNVSMTDIVGRIETYSKELKAQGYAVEPQIRGNTTQASKSESSDTTGKVIAGAALGALVMALLSGR
ncbi:helix-turn-helix domain-containing protein [Marinomonas aquiplantarum]|uniref:Helix-turn-helix protein n=1 Tax=Marinomonas aquiplantarum TaxID=491951 RepID=A0A366CXT9_9GAMM|nr:helix-turn-helix transcriptional regulator [Marinomonas aquiplantarum]RBO82660.1 helix-turn-helix protein [Marinomonas aquiplantarum]